ncbi:putative phage-type endonuclease [Alkalibacterium subtropicum]|uniref:Putative phage-type endonuclease n=1 Tax=Alkalibacterium subtropicum TaxID=753702 RepID=A0A1I1EU73_9LACT|nr:YqaJ viral recombinase family protein [Alkalibacterium subtropicum]SFB90232.1 putative phage-type endonuclease [Alkalibacterium subtropicum]
MQTIDTRSMTHRDWLEQRRSGIGGSDVATILGLNKYNSPYQLWLDKTGQVEIDDSDVSDAAHFGNILEEVVAKEFTERTGKKVRRANRMFLHPDYPFLTANIDRDIVGEDAILECKTASMYLADRWEGEEIPEQYICQVQHYMNVLDRDYAYIAVLIGGQKFVWKKIERDQELIDIIQKQLVEFWEVNVKQMIPPAIDGSQSTEDYIKERYAKSEPGKEIALKKDIDDLLDQREELQETKKVVETSIKEIDNMIKVQLGDQEAEVGIAPRHIVTWRPIESTRIDSKRIKKEAPELFDKYSKVSSYKKFTIKEIK